MKKRSLEALKARDLGRKALQGPLGWLRAPLDITAELRSLHARIVGPTEQRPYWTVYHANGRYLGAGKTPGRAIAAAIGRGYLDKPPSHSA